jgi:hypothetical protein
VLEGLEAAPQAVDAGLQRGESLAPTSSCPGAAWCWDPSHRVVSGGG